MKLDELSPELQERVKACKTPQEMLDLAREEGYSLSDEELESISGGKGFWDYAACEDDCEQYWPIE